MQCEGIDGVISNYSIPRIRRLEGGIKHEKTE